MEYVRWSMEQRIYIIWSEGREQGWGRTLWREWTNIFEGDILDQRCKTIMQKLVLGEGEGKPKQSGGDYG
jgi:hypothetical protein